MGYYCTWQHAEVTKIATLNVNLTYYRFGFRSDFPREICIWIALPWGILFPRFLRGSMSLSRFMLSRSGPFRFPENTTLQPGNARGSLWQALFQGETAIYQEPGRVPGTLHVIAVRVLERNRWHAQTGIIGENLIKGLFTKGSMGQFQGNKQGMLYCIRPRNCGEPFPPLDLQQLRREHLKEPREKGATKPEPQPTFHPRHQAGR